MKHGIGVFLLRCLFATCLAGYFISAQAAEDTYEEDTTLKEADAFFGAGFRVGVNIGYMHYRKKKSWDPF